MPCFHTRIGFRSKHVNPETGLRPIVFSRSQALHPVIEEEMPCGQCTHCRLKTSRDWGTRVALESTLYDFNSFITLTYSPEHLPKYALLDYDAPVLFMKRLRERYGPGIRSFGCAEYGEKFSRPHFHICLLNHDFRDKKIIGNSTANFGKLKRENPLFDSEELQDLWPFGHTSIGSLTLESASYVARYCTKKITGKDSPYHYDFVDERSGEIITRPPEKAICKSMRRGIGYPWYEKYGQYVRDHDCVYVEGRRVPVPKYFDSLTEKIDPDRFEEIKAKRKIAGKRGSDKINKESHEAWLVNPLSEHRLTVMERCQNLSFKLLKRDIENG